MKEICVRENKRDMKEMGVRENKRDMEETCVRENKRDMKETCVRGHKRRDVFMKSRILICRNKRFVETKDMMCL